jgi:lipopolysaccharide/colanic/teichoic acid biosynthesis glycosyltransferase
VGHENILLVGTLRQQRWDSLERALDLTLVVLTAPIWTPLLAGLIALKALIDGGPVLFGHVRVGRHGVPFTLYKIRTTPHSFEASPEDWPDEDFPPRTRFGQWLRRWDLDELPQLWNVLCGEMSLVGPRPETPYHSAKFAEMMPRFSERVLVRPGLSGLAQVRGWRGDTNVRQRLASDLEYLGRRGFRTWVAILVRTVWMESSGQGRGARVVLPSPRPASMRSQSDFPNP